MSETMQNLNLHHSLSYLENLYEQYRRDPAALCT